MTKPITNPATGERPYVTKYEADWIDGAVGHAVEKHPRFCRVVTSMDKTYIDNALDAARKDADSSGAADAIIVEELLETLQAYLAGDFHAAREESFHLVATAIRLEREITHEAYRRGVFKGKDRQ